jgi:hypothetical protein
MTGPVQREEIGPRKRLMVQAYPGSLAAFSYLLGGGDQN